MKAATSLNQIPMVGSSSGAAKVHSPKPAAVKKTAPPKEKTMAKKKSKRSKALRGPLAKAADLVHAKGGRVIHKRRGPIMIAGSKVGKVGESSAKKFGKAAIEKAVSEKHTMSAVGAAAVLGYLKGSDSLPEIPSIGGLSPEAILGIAAWGGAKWSKSRTLEHLSTGLLSVAAYQMAQEAAQGGGGETPGPQGWDDDDY